MAVYFATENPQQLLTSLENLIQGGAIQDWYIPQQGQLTQTSNQWIRQAYLQPFVTAGELRFYVRTYQGRLLTRRTYQHYQEVILETFLQHLQGHFAQATATPDATALELAS